ncbi:hypothetical protein [Curtobacterium luteum]|uniref:Uncharacterized protein n=1 Tax=Curtobacterium luteum TaxID=33881 RepID=A0A175S163_9MICO|nr:hypothetical protein [Curtobacterium luteum]KTR08991.1 hypothetical protein NS184_04025 [Curtobacterium luteum]
MSSSDAQPPLSRRQARERERAAAAGGQPATPPPTVAAPASTDRSEQSRRRPGSHVAPAPSGAAQSGVPDVPPASATEIVPGTGGLTRRQLRLMREAEVQAVLPVPLQNPTPQSSDRTVQDVIGSVSTLEDDQAAPVEPTPAVSAPTRAASAAPAEDAEAHVELDDAVVHQATEADGSPDAVEPLDEAAAHAEEPRRHRSTWAPHDAEPDVEAVTAPADDTAPTAVGQPDADASDASAAPIAPKLPNVDAATPAVFPLSLDDDTNETPVQRSAADSTASSGVPASSEVPAAFQRPVEPKPVTTAFQPAAGHWSALAHDSNDAEVHDEETGTRRVAASNPNAIVLPNSALADPTGALNATGEVILTGSIDLPASLSSTGSHRPIDGAEVDRLLEQHDEQPETDASPIRASRAVSSHTSTRQVVLAAAKPKESKTPMVLAVSVGAVGVAAAAVIIVALLTTHPFG